MQDQVNSEDKENPHHLSVGAWRFNPRKSDEDLVNEIVDLQPENLQDVERDFYNSDFNKPLKPIENNFEGWVDENVEKLYPGAKTELRE